jgi:hypothetical protein
MNPNDWPDKTLEEALESEEDFECTDEDWDDIDDEIEERRNTMELAACSAMFGRMMRDNHITFREYIRLTNALDEYQREWDAVL